MAKQKKRQDGYFKRTFTYNGKRYYVYGKTAEELNKKEAEKRAELQGKVEKRENPTISEYAEKWFDRRRDTVKENTLRGQQLIFNVIKAVFIESADRTFGELKIQEVSIDDIRTLQTELRKPYTIETKDGKIIEKQRKTLCVNDYMALVKHLMNDAKKEHIIDFNPCESVNNLKRTEETARNSYHRALTKEEQKAFFECERTKNSFYYDVFRFAINTGMRIGEIGALKYTDIRAGKIYVCRTITRAECGGYCIGKDAKTKAGVRTIPLNDDIKQILEHQKEINIALDGNVFDRIFCAVERGLLTAGVVDREIKRICKEIDIEPFTCHGFRATFITRAIEAGMPPKTLQELVGHENFNLTYSLYGHVTESTKESAMQNLKIVI